MTSLVCGPFVSATPCALCLHSCRRPQLLVAKITCNFSSALPRPCLALPSLDDSQITQENRETAETELAKARVRVRKASSALFLIFSPQIDRFGSLLEKGRRLECNPSLDSRSRVKEKDVAATTSLCVGGGRLRLDARIGGGAGRRQQKGQK